MLKRIFKILAYTLLTLLLLVMIAFWMLTREKYQNILAKKGAAYLSEKLNTKVVIGHVKIDFLNHVNLKEVYIEDQRKDTLAFIGNLQLRTSELFLNYWKGTAPVIHTLSIENAYVNLNREKDSIWNYNFIEQAFSGKSDTSIKVKETSSKSVASSSSSPEIDLKTIKCEQVRFFMNDGWRGENMNFTVAQLNLSSDKIDLNNQIIALKELSIEGADVLVKEYEGNKPEDLTPDDTTEWGTPFNPDNLRLSVALLTLKDAQFRYIDGEPEGNQFEFDEKNIGVKNIQLTLKNTSVDHDTLFTDLDHLSAIERCGLQIKKLKTKVKFSQVQTIMDELLLETNHSTLTNHYEMHYRNFHDFKDYINKVRMTAHLTNTSVSSIDVGYFANLLNQYPILIDLNGDVDGTVNYLNGKNILLKTRNTIFQGDATVTGLPDIENTFFNVTVNNLSTTGKDLNELIPQTRVDGVAWNELSKIQFKGRYEGQVDEFYARGNLNTNLGNALVDLNMNFKPSIPSYEGDIQTERFHLGKLLKQNKLGRISMNGSIKGSGFDLDNLNARIDATVSNIEADSNTYTNLTINGLIEKKKFDGIFISKDSNLAINFKGKLDLSGKEPVYNFNSRFIRFNLQKLGITKEPMIGSGYASLNFQGSTIDNFTGSVSLKNLIIENKGQTYSLNDLLLESFQQGNLKTLKLSSSLADAEVSGKFNLSELPKAISMYLHHYLPQYIKKPTQTADQELTFSASIKNTNAILNSFLPGYTGLSGSYITGGLNTKLQLFSLDANIPSFGYQEFLLNNIAIVGSGDYKQFDLNIVSGNLLYHQDIVIPSFQVNGLMASDTASLSIITQSVNDILGDAFLNVKATALNNNLYVDVLPSNISIKEDKWQLRSGDELVLGKEIHIKDLIFESGAQRITINSKADNPNDLIVDLNELDLESIGNYLNQTNPTFYGRLSGQLDIKDFISHPNIVASVYSASEFRIDNDTLGLANIQCNYDSKNNIIRFLPGTTLKRNLDQATLSGYINLKDSTISMDANLNNMSIAFANQFIIDYVTELKGNTTGQISINGKLANPNIKGNLYTTAASCHVIYLGTNYEADEIKLTFDNNRINLEPFKIHDERNGEYNSLVSGYLSHNNFDDIKLNLKAVSDNFLCLNTNEWDNDLFYGYVLAKIDASVKGALDDVTLDVDVKPLKGSTFHMPISSSGDASAYDYIEFVDIGKDQAALKKKKNNNYFKINMNIEATTQAEAFIILDKNTREEIQAKGTGDIKLNIDMGNSMNMFGTYVITEGKYNFNFRGLFPRVFTIDEGSKIEWKGDPLLAKLNVKAIYKLPKTLELYPLIAGLTDDENEIRQAKQRYETFISLNLEGELATPDITFDISQPSNKAIGSMAYDKLVQIKNDENELISQSGVLLLFGEFKGSDPIGSGTYERGGIATASDLIGNALSSGLTNVFSEITGLNNINLNVGYKTLAATAEEGNRDQFNVGISANLFKDRVIFDFGSNIDVDRNTASKASNNVNIGGDFRAQYLATEDGRLRLNAFRTSNYNAEGVNVTKGGVGVSYKKVFNSLGEFFTSKKRKNRAKQMEATKKSDS